MVDDVCVICVCVTLEGGSREKERRQHGMYTLCRQALRAVCADKQHGAKQQLTWRVRAPRNTRETRVLRHSKQTLAAPVSGGA